MTTPAGAETTTPVPEMTDASAVAGEEQVLTVPWVAGDPADQGAPQTPVTSGEEAGAATPTLPGQPTPLDDYTQQRLARADQLETQYREQQVETAIANELNALGQEADLRGLSAEDRSWLLDRYSQTLRQNLQEQQQFRADQDYRQGKLNAVYQYAQEFGVNPQDLMMFNSPQDMRKWAAGEKTNREYRESTEARLKVIELGRVPAQTLSTTGISRAGGQVVTRENIDLLYSQGRVTDETYRTFMDTGVIR